MQHEGSSWGLSKHKVDGKGEPLKKTKGEITVKAHAPPNTRVSYWASQSSQTGYSFSGSGLPYPNEDIAFNGTPNKGVTMTDNVGEFTVQITKPNSYYDSNRNLINPTLYYKVLFCTTRCAF